MKSMKAIRATAQAVWMCLQNFGADGPAPDHFDQSKKNVAAVQHRERQQVQQREVHIDHDAEPQNQPPSMFTFKQIAVEPNDHDGAAKLLHANVRISGKNGAEGRKDLSGAVLDLFQRSRMNDGHVGFTLARHNAERRTAIFGLNWFFSKQCPFKFLRSRRTVSVIGLTGLLLIDCSAVTIAFGLKIFCPSIATIWSPGRKPASAAGLLVATS